METIQKLIEKINQLNTNTPVRNVIEVELMLGYTIRLYESLLEEKNNLQSRKVNTGVSQESTIVFTLEEEKVDAKPPSKTEETKISVQKNKEEPIEKDEEKKSGEEHAIPSIGDIAKKFVTNLMTKITPQEKEQTESHQVDFADKVDEDDFIKEDEEMVEENDQEIVLKIDEQESEESVQNIGKEQKPETPPVTSGISFEPPPNPKEVTPKIEEIIVKKTSENDKAETKVIGDTGSWQPVSAQGFIAPKHPKQKDFKSSIGFNDLFLYINELFGKDKSAFDLAISRINEFDNYSDAKEWIDEEIAPAYLWDKENSVVTDFYTLVEHHFKTN